MRAAIYAYYFTLMLCSLPLISIIAAEIFASADAAIFAITH